MLGLIIVGVVCGLTYPLFNPFFIHHQYGNNQLPAGGYLQKVGHKVGRGGAPEYQLRLMSVSMKFGFRKGCSIMLFYDSFMNFDYGFHKRVAHM